MFGLRKKGTSFFGTGSRQSTKSRSSAARQVAVSHPKKSSGPAAPHPQNSHSKSRSKTKNSLGAGISKSHQTGSRSGKVKVVKVHRPSSQSKSSKKGPHSRSNGQKRDISKSVLTHSKQRNSRTKKFENSTLRVRRSNLTAFGMSTQQKQPDDVFTSDDAERGANGKLLSPGRYRKFVMWCTKLGIFVTMLGQLGFIIHIFVIDILRDEIPTSTGLVLSLTHLMIIFLSLEVVCYATKTLCLFTCLADLLAIVASFIYIAIRESSNNYLGKNVTATQNAKILHQAVFATAESCVLLMCNLCMVLMLYTEIRTTSSTEIGVAVMSMDLESADQERERRADLEKAGLTQKGASGGGHVAPLERQRKMATLAPMKAPQQQSAATDRSNAFSKSGKASVSTATSPQHTPRKEIPVTVLASVLPGSEKSTTSQKPSPPKSTIPPTSSKQTLEKPRVLAQNVPIATSLDMAVPPQTAGSLEPIQTVKLANETPEVMTAIPQQATNNSEKPIASTFTANVTGTSIARSFATSAADPVAAASARPPSSASGATLMRYLYEGKQKTNQ